MGELKYFYTDMGGGFIRFIYETKHWCRVTYSEDKYMPEGTVFPAKDLGTLKCDIHEITGDEE